MTAIETLEALAGDCWPCDLRAHLIGGIVVARPEFAVLLRPVWREWDREKLTNPWEVAPDGDCWFLWGLAGNPTACFQAAWAAALAAGIDPWKKWVAFERFGSLRIREFRSLHTHLFNRYEQQGRRRRRESREETIPRESTVSGSIPEVDEESAGRHESRNADAP